MVQASPRHCLEPAHSELGRGIHSGRIAEGVGHVVGNAGETSGALAAQLPQWLSQPKVCSTDHRPVSRSARASLQLDEAPLIRLLLDDAVAHAVEAAALLALLGPGSAVEDGKAQAGPRLLTVIEGRRHVAVQHIDQHNGEQDVALGIDQRYAPVPA